MATRTKQLNCDFCQQPRPFDKPGPNHVLHLLMFLITFGLWAPLWILVVLADSPKEYHCRSCGGNPVSLRKVSPKAPFTFLSPAFLVLLAVLSIAFLATGQPDRERSVENSARRSKPRARLVSATQSPAVAPTTRDLPTPIIDGLLREYPKLRGSKLQWRDASGTVHFAIPAPFWGNLSNHDRRALADELDAHLRTTSWIINTGRYKGNGKMMLDFHHTRASIVGLQP